MYTVGTLVFQSVVKKTITSIYIRAGDIVTHLQAQIHHVVSTKSLTCTLMSIRPVRPWDASLDAYPLQIDPMHLARTHAALCECQAAPKMQ
jgi:hypothetical protein